MKFLKVLLVIVAILAIIFFLGGLFLPKTYSVSRATTIKATDSVVYNNIANFNEFYKWNPWAKMEPTAKTSVTGTPLQPGHIYAWEGKETGTGQMKINTAETNKMVDIELKFIKPFESIADTRFDIVPENNGTKVTWSMSGENKGTMNKWMGLMMDSMIGKDFEDGLKYLKSKSEKGE
jgi:hypothetical protein